jgi:hypothetical protein
MFRKRWSENERIEFVGLWIEIGDMIGKIDLYQPLLRVVSEEV